MSRNAVSPQVSLMWLFISAEKCSCPVGLFNGGDTGVCGAWWAIASLSAPGTKLGGSLSQAETAERDLYNAFCVLGFWMREAVGVSGWGGFGQTQTVAVVCVCQVWGHALTPPCVEDLDAFGQLGNSWSHDRQRKGPYSLCSSQTKAPATNWD